jgi:hypothetical protein
VKIIARISEDELLVEMTEREIANVTGKNGTEELAVRNPYGSSRTGFETGTEYKVSTAWDRLTAQAKAAKQLERVSKILDALSDLVTQTKVQFTNATVATEASGGAR